MIGFCVNVLEIIKGDMSFAKTICLCIEMVFLILIHVNILNIVKLYAIKGSVLYMSIILWVYMGIIFTEEVNPLKPIKKPNKFIVIASYVIPIIIVLYAFIADDCLYFVHIVKYINVLIILLCICVMIFRIVKDENMTKYLLINIIIVKDKNMMKYLLTNITIYIIILIVAVILCNQQELQIVRMNEINKKLREMHRCLFKKHCSIIDMEQIITRQVASKSNVLNEEMQKKLKLVQNDENNLYDKIKDTLKELNELSELIDELRYTGNVDFFQKNNEYFKKIKQITDDFKNLNKFTNTYDEELNKVLQHSKNFHKELNAFIKTLDSSTQNEIASKVKSRMKGFVNRVTNIVDDLNNDLHEILT